MKKRVGLGRQRLQDERDERIRVRKRGTAGFGGSSLTSGASAGIVTAAISFARRSNASEIVPGLRSVQNSNFFEMTDFLEPPTGMGRSVWVTVTILAVGCIFIRCRGDLAPLSREKSDPTAGHSRAHRGYPDRAHRGDHGRQSFRGAGGAQPVPGARRRSLRPFTLRVPSMLVQVIPPASERVDRVMSPRTGCPARTRSTRLLACLTLAAPVPSHMLTCPRSLSTRRSRTRA